MTTPKHTPGPWTAACGRRRFRIYRAADRLGRLGPLVDLTTQPNARLIAAAPELLAALRDLRAVLSSFDGRSVPRPADPAWDQVPIALEIARAAIRSAEGDEG